jgi:hypothetical protein
MSHCGAKLHIPSTQFSEREQVVPCIVNFCNGRELRISTQEPLALGAAVSVEHEDTLLLGEVVRSYGHGDGRWQHLIQIKQVLNGLMTIMALRARLLQESPKSFYASKP